MRKRILALLTVLAFIPAGMLPAGAYTMTGTGYVIQNDVISVIVPTTLDFSIDPLEIGGRGSIYSDEYPLVNLGDNDVILTFTNVDVIFANDKDFAPSAEPIPESGTGGLKTAYLTLDFGNSDISPIVLTDSHPWEIPAITLGASHKQNSQYALCVSGSVNPYPDIDWQSGDVQISLTYQLQSITEVEDAAESKRKGRDQDEDADLDDASEQSDEDRTEPSAANGSPASSAEPPATGDSPATGTEPPVTDESPATDTEPPAADSSAPADAEASAADSSPAADAEASGQSDGGSGDGQPDQTNENRGAEQ